MKNYVIKKQFLSKANEEETNFSDLSKWFLGLVTLGIIYCVGVLLEQQSSDWTFGERQKIRLFSYQKVFRINRNDLRQNERGLAIKIKQLDPSLKYSDIEANNPELVYDVNMIYFRGKNIVYRRPTYFGELRDIERRLAFVRTLIPVSIVILITGFVSLIMLCLKYLSNSKHIKSLKYQFSIFIFIVGIPLLIFSFTSWQKEQRILNMKVFGYYIDSEERKKEIEEYEKN